MVFLLLMAGSRIGYRLFREGHLFFTRHAMAPGQVPILIVGGGGDAKALLLSLEDHASEYYPVGVLDDGVEGGLLGGVPVLGRIADVERVVEKFRDAGDRPRKLVMVDRTLPSARLHALVESANRLGLTMARAPDPTRFQPGTSDAAELQPISVEDLLGRPQIVLDPRPVHRFVAGRRVLVTGAGGSSARKSCGRSAPSVRPRSASSTPPNSISTRSTPKCRSSGRRSNGGARHGRAASPLD